MNGWTPARRAPQSALIRNWRPWEKATGPKSEDGKARVSRNPYKGGTRAMLRELARLLRESPRALSKVINAAPSLVIRPMCRSP